jgi:DNA replication and repair protein RecF
MYLQSLEVHNFRNFLTRRFEFSPEVNIVYGPNASGKTNLLEAVYLLSNLRSFRTHRLRDLIHWDQPHAHLRGIVRPDQQNPSESGNGADTDKPPTTSGKTLAVQLEPASRTAFLQSKPCRSSRDYLQILPSTAFVPDDLELVKGQPTARRFFLDRGTFQYYPPYWSVLTDYKKNLQQKNAALRQFKETGRKNSESRAPRPGVGNWEIWNAQLQQIGSQVIWHRLRFLHGIRRLLPAIYTQWLGDAESLDVRYQASIRVDTEDLAQALGDPDMSAAHILERLTRAYATASDRSLDRELRLGATLVGPHRDDLDMYLHRGELRRDLRAFGSQGQQRTAVLALKIAEVLLYFEQHQEYAVLVLDDVTSELDDRRAERLFEYVRHGMQVFISATNKPDFLVDRSLDCAYFDLTAAP